MAVHSFDLGDNVAIYQMHPSKGLMYEGNAWVIEIVDDVDEQYVVRFHNEPGETYERFVDRDGQQCLPADYIREFNKKIGKAA